MTQYWQTLVARIDALSMRERIIVFVMVALVVLMSANAVLLDPLYAKHKLLSEQVIQDQAKTADIQREIQQKLRAQAVDPDEADRKRLAELNKQLVQMQSALLDMQKGLVPPDKMAALLEDILKRNGQLRLITLKTLPVSSLIEAEAAAVNRTVAGVVAKASVAPGASAEKSAAQSAPTVYKHGVELTVQGGYVEMMHYMAALESMPWQLLWGKAKLHVDDYPKATLTLTLFTMSLEKKWLTL